MMLKKMISSKYILAALSVFLITYGHDAVAQVLSLDMGGTNGQNSTVTGRIVQMMALLTVLSLAPSILMMMTSFIRMGQIQVEAGILREGLAGFGMQHRDDARDGRRILPPGRRCAAPNRAEDLGGRNRLI